ncbi:MAG: hypothetical protein H8D23_21615 [Candidatus Brocadiales bacterium]|nr:hypothetical protein [Candidatus Brocadiales bacterium]
MKIDVLELIHSLALVIANADYKSVKSYEKDLRDFVALIQKLREITRED